jgi:hypothetical protein
MVEQPVKQAATAAAISAMITLGVVHLAHVQGEATAELVAKGHHLAVQVCLYCHLAAPDQGHLPLLHPPAPPFDSIAQRSDINADYLRKFLTTIHRDLESKKGMPNPKLMNFQINEAIAYILSLRK